MTYLALAGLFILWVLQVIPALPAMLVTPLGVASSKIFVRLVPILGVYSPQAADLLSGFNNVMADIADETDDPYTETLPWWSYCYALAGLSLIATPITLLLLFLYGLLLLGVAVYNPIRRAAKSLT